MKIRVFFDWSAKTPVFLWKNKILDRVAAGCRHDSRQDGGATTFQRQARHFSTKLLKCMVIKDFRIHNLDKKGLGRVNFSFIRSREKFGSGVRNDVFLCTLTVLKG